MDIGPLVGAPRVVYRRSTDPTCRHTDAIEVRTLLDGELVAHWCEACETQLPADWTRPVSQYGELLHRIGVGTITPVVAILNRCTGEWVNLDPPLYAAPGDLDRVVAERQAEIEAAWEATHEG